MQKNGMRYYFRSYVICLGLCLIVFFPMVVVAELMENLHQVSDHLYRSGRPNEKGLRELKINTIINLENDARAVDADRKLAKKLGIKFINIPMDHYEIQDHEKVKKILQAMDDGHNGKVLVHCKRGNDRTGMIVGLYRVEYQKWNPNDAYDEMVKIGFHEKFDKLKDHYWWEVKRLARQGKVSCFSQILNRLVEY